MRNWFVQGTPCAATAVTIDCAIDWSTCLHFFRRTSVCECACARTKILLSFTHTHAHTPRVTLCCILLGQKIEKQNNVKKTRNSSQFFAYRPSWLAIRLFCYVFSFLTDNWACFCRYSDNATATQIEMGSIIECGRSLTVLNSASAAPLFTPQLFQVNMHFLSMCVCLCFGQCICIVSYRSENWYFCLSIEYENN